MNRRLNNELNSIDLKIDPEKLSNWNLDIFDITYKKIIHYEVYKKDNKVSDIDFLLYHNKQYYIINLYDLNNYPFVPPRIKINNTYYLSLLKKEYMLYNNKKIIDKTQINKIHLEKLLNINIKNCCCCKSIICRENWCPVNNIGHIFKEILKYLDRKQNFLEIIFLTKIMLKNLDFVFYYMYEFL